MKIVHITQFFHPERGYQENHLSILQAKDGHDITIICTNDLTRWGINKTKMEQMDTYFTKEYSIKIIRLSKVFEFSTRIFVRGLSDKLRAVQPDLLIIHAVSLPMSLQAMKWGARHNIRMIVDDHMVEAGSFNRFAKIFYNVFRNIFPTYIKVFKIKVSKWIAVSKETKEFMLKNYGIKDKVEIVPLGYDDNTVFFDIENGRQWLLDNNLSIDLPYVLYIGKFDKMKNPIDLLDGYKKFQKEHQEYRLLLVGDPSKEYADRLKKKIIELNIKDKVFLVKSVPNNKMRYVFSIAQLVIWPHGSSMAMLEAMACECPVIAPDIKVNRERLSDGRGEMFIENNLLDLVNKMTFVLENKDIITPKAKKWVNEFAWSKLTDRFL